MDNINSIDVEYNKLNDDWIHNFEKTDKLYQDFYKDDLYYINLKYLYINSNNEIEKINHETFLLSVSNKITREEVLRILKRSKSMNNVNYSLLSILRYNILIDAIDVRDFLLYPIVDSKYLSVIKNIDTITFEKTISMFQDLNELIFLFYEKTNLTKDNNNNSSTKKIYLTTNKTNVNTSKRHNKTIKKDIKNNIH